MTNRRTFVRGAGLAILSVSLGASAQRSGTIPRVGYLTPGANPREQGFWQGMRDLGYVEGKTIIVERRSADGDFSRLPALALEIAKTRPDVIVAIVSASSIAAKQATWTIPIVMVGAADPVGAGLVGNLARPGGNVTGTSSQSTAAVSKVLELVRELRPGATRVAALWDPVNAISQQLSLQPIRFIVMSTGKSRDIIATPGTLTPGTPIRSNRRDDGCTRWSNYLASRFETSRHDRRLH